MTSRELGSMISWMSSVERLRIVGRMTHRFAIRLVAPVLFAVAVLQIVPATQAQERPNKSEVVETNMYIEGTGCPSGAVCIYPQNAGWNNARPSHIYWRYGYHNLRNQYGVHRIYNNQTGGATMRTCLGYNGTRCEGYLPAGWYIDKNLTPINSITLQP
jgi:hypothetical protein